MLLLAAHKLAIDLNIIARHGFQPTSTDRYIKKFVYFVIKITFRPDFSVFTVYG